MSKKDSFNKVTKELDASGATGFVLVMLGSAAIISVSFGIAPFLLMLAGLFAAFLFVAKFLDMVE